jgi:hypothetical protein
VDGGEAERLGAEGVGEVNAEGGTADGEADELAEGSVAEIVGRDGIRGLGNLLGGGPAGDPDLGVRGGLGVRGWLSVGVVGEEGCGEEKREDRGGVFC